MDVAPNNPSQLKAALQQGPVAVALQASHLVFTHYSGGIITDHDCGVKINHGALAVGYGFENGLEYFLVKNSWGTQWGDNGYVKIGVSEFDGVCGIQVAPVTVDYHVHQNLHQNEMEGGPEEDLLAMAHLL